MDKLKEYLRILRLAKTPKKLEFFRVVKITGVIILAIGIMGFVIYIAMVQLPRVPSRSVLLFHVKYILLTLLFIVSILMMLAFGGSIHSYLFAKIDIPTYFIVHGIAIPATNYRVSIGRQKAIPKKGYIRIPKRAYKEQKFKKINAYIRIFDLKLTMVDLSKYSEQIRQKIYFDLNHELISFYSRDIYNAIAHLNENIEQRFQKHIYFIDKNFKTFHEVLSIILNGNIKIKVNNSSANFNLGEGIHKIEIIKVNKSVSAFLFFSEHLEKIIINEDFTEVAPIYNENINSFVNAMQIINCCLGKDYRLLEYNESLKKIPICFVGEKITGIEAVVKRVKKREAEIQVKQKERWAGIPEYIIQQYILDQIKQISHPHICKIFDYVFIGNYLYVIMERYEETLEGLINNKPMPLLKAVDICIQICKGLQSLHGEKIIHRDIKPLNIMINETVNGKQEVKIIDFDITTIKGALTGGAGTPCYIPKEQIIAPIVNVPATDIFSLGVCSYKMLTGQLPFDGITTREIFEKTIRGDFRPPSEINPELRGIEKIILKMLENDFNKRYASVNEILRDLDEFLGRFG